jgi:hypothetical protein
MTRVCLRDRELSARAERPHARHVNSGNPPGTDSRFLRPWRCEPCACGMILCEIEGTALLNVDPSGARGRPTRLLPNAASAQRIRSHLDHRSSGLFSEIKAGLHMGIVTATESRADSRGIPDPRAHSTVPAGPVRCSSTGRQVGPQGMTCGKTYDTHENLRLALIADDRGATAPRRCWTAPLVVDDGHTLTVTGMNRCIGSLTTTFAMMSSKPRSPFVRMMKADFLSIDAAVRALNPGLSPE